MLYALLAGLAMAGTLVSGKRQCQDDPECRKQGPYALHKDGTGGMTQVMRLILEARAECKLANACPLAVDSQVNGRQRCIFGRVNVDADTKYPCEGIDMLAFVSLSDLGSGDTANGNDIWGWTDPSTGDLYALTGQTDGMSIVDVTDPENPDVLIFIPSNVGVNTVWRDMKVWNNTVYIVADDRLNAHGMQVFDLFRVTALKKELQKNPEAYSHKRLGDPVVMQPDYVYTGFGSCHNIVINEQKAYAYGVGSRTCNGGLHITDLSNRLMPEYVGCFSSDGYTHDAECLTYDGPDARYSGHEICFNYNEDTLTIVDVQDPSNPVMISRTGYPTARYTHQGWCTPDHKYLLLNDELDEIYENINGGNATTFIWNIQDLENPTNIGWFIQNVQSVDHNLYIKENQAYLSNYEAGLRILNLDEIGDGQARRVAFFDTYPEANSVNFDGIWSNYPYFDGFVIAQTIDRGFFILQQTNN